MAQEKFLPEWAMWSFTVRVRLYYPVREGICAINHMQISTMFPSIMLVPIWKKITILLYFSDLGHREDYRHWHFSNRHGPAWQHIYPLHLLHFLMEVARGIMMLVLGSCGKVLDSGGCRRLTVRRGQGNPVWDAVPDVFNQSTVGHSWAPQPQWWHLGEYI